ncbi:hypothetical protein KD050_00185 [Psychrobacillus sp. INOP01]|uniref:hypothetical protein n=1 Tax=Psychrobacillus sp. INOP01 TaxID=2829187 RepID=UPI001BAE07F6|nr:hypothetical protein [Psychrobacillus sp. INOP01]QUG41761.1 hypothetical protein KD050_00185 [Psychrobacillus sp. INOP01]
MIDYFERKIRLKDFEVWNVRIGKQHYPLVILDEFRPATFEDFEMPKLIYEEDNQRVNYVSATYYSKEPIKDEHREILGEFARMLTEHLALAHCEVIIKMYQENPEQAIDRIMLTKYGFKESDIPLEKLWHLNQE